MAVVLNGSQHVEIGTSVSAVDIRVAPIGLYAEFRTSLASVRWIYFHGSGTGLGGADYALRLSASGQVVAVWGHGTTSQAMVTSPLAYNDGNWHRALLRLVQSGSNSVLHLYIDGASVGSTVVTGTHNTTAGGDRTHIGTFQNTLDAFSQRWNGQLANVGVWARAFTIAQSENLTSGATAPTFFTANRRALWPLDYNARDLGPNNLTGTPANGPLWTVINADVEATLPAITAGDESTSMATFEATLPAITAGDESTSMATFEATLPAITATFEASQTFSATFTAVLPRIRAYVNTQLLPPRRWRFFPPVENRPPMALEPPILRRYSWPRGISVIRSGDTFVTTDHVVPRRGWIEGRDYFVGGYHYTRIPEDVAEALIAAGFEPEEEVRA